MVQALWLLIGAGTIVLFGAAMQQKNHKLCADVKVEISGAEEHLFIDENDVKQIIHSNEMIVSRALETVELRNIEAALESTPWVKKAELFFDNNQVLQIKIEERQPIARVFTKEGTSFYLDSTGLRLPLSEKLSARVPMFTDFPSDKKVMAAPDSLLLQNVVTLGKYIMADSFWMAQTAQIAITPQSTFELLPTIGDHIVVLCSIDNLDAKFKRLYTFYSRAWMQNGINTYEKLDVQFNNQVVAVKRGTSKAIEDSAKAKQMLANVMQGSLASLTDTSIAVTPEFRVLPVVATVKDSVKAAKPVVKKVKKPVAAVIQKKKLPLKQLNNNKKKTNPLSIVDIKKKPKAVMKKGR